MPHVNSEDSQKITGKPTCGHADEFQDLHLSKATLIQRFQSTIKSNDSIQNVNRKKLPYFKILSYWSRCEHINRIECNLSKFHLASSKLRNCALAEWERKVKKCFLGKLQIFEALWRTICGAWKGCVFQRQHHPLYFSIKLCTLWFPTAFKFKGSKKWPLEVDRLTYRVLGLEVGALAPHKKKRRTSSHGEFYHEVP